LNKVNEIVSIYTKKLSKLVKTPDIKQGYFSSWAQYTIILESREQRDGLQSFLKKKGIPSAIYYPTPLHKQSVYQQFSQKMAVLPVSLLLSKRVLSLPIHPHLTSDEVDLVCNEIIAFFDH